MNLYRCFNTNQDEPVQFVGVYATRWRPAWGEPSVMFREVQESESLTFARQVPEVQALVAHFQAFITKNPKGEPYCRDCDYLLRYGHDEDCASAKVLAPFQEPATEGAGDG